MGISNPTDEQLAIIHHPMGKHARVLAVAGSGKTTTMVARIKYLVEDRGTDPQLIDVYMFNANAADEFRSRLSLEVPGQQWGDNVHTFHAAALSIINKGVRRNIIVPYREKWLDEVGASIEKRHLRSIIKRMVHKGDADEGELTADDALRMIGLWKSNMITPEDATCESTPQYVQVYEEFERERRKVPALTFDDFVPVAVNILKKDPELLADEIARRAFMIIDEYQDINEGQQRFMRLLAGNRSDVMVVGDDDQTIYEWRGAQPEYILRGFDHDFAGKPVVVYPLSHSFRFGPLLAQSAYNVITENRDRAAKELIAHNSEAVTEVSIIEADTSQPTTADPELAQSMSSLLHVEQVAAKDIMTLGRTYAQMEPLEAECLKAHVPFLVPKKGPFFTRAENLVLVDYMRLALLLDVRVRDVAPCYGRSGRGDYTSGGYQGEAVQMVLSTINVPRRYVARDDVERAMLKSAKLGWTVRDTFGQLSSPESPIERIQTRVQIGEYLRLLESIAARIAHEPTVSAGTLMSWILDASKYTQGPPNTPASDEDNPDDLEASVRNFLDYAEQTELGPTEFVGHLGTLDTTCGMPHDQCVLFTSIHRAKGLEADYVFLPGCNDGAMPVHLAGHVEDVLGSRDGQSVGVALDHMESERRLFYVAVTRARKQLYIGTERREVGGSVSPFLAEMQLEMTRIAVKAFWDVLRSKARDVNDIVCRSFVHTFVGLVTNERVRKYMRDNYVSQLNIPQIRECLDDVLAGASGDPSAADIGGNAVRVAAAPARKGTLDEPGKPWWQAFIQSPEQTWTLSAKPVAGSLVPMAGTVCTELYHVTRVSNLPSIFASGLQCWNGANSLRGCRPFPNGVVRRRADPIPLTGKPVAAYVPLSFCARSPFLHEVTRKAGMPDEEIAILCFTTRVFLLPGTIYSNKDVCHRPVNFYKVKELPAHIDWSAVNASGWPDDITRVAKAAEVLVPCVIPSMFMSSVIVCSEAALVQSRDTVRKWMPQAQDTIPDLARCIDLLRVDSASFFPQESR